MVSELHTVRMTYQIRSLCSSYFKEDCGMLGLPYAPKSLSLHLLSLLVMATIFSATIA